MEPVQAPEQFVAELRQVLQDLYDPLALRRSPLLRALLPEEDRNPVATLRRAITEAIGQLKPGNEVPPYAAAWRVYRLLVYRYIEQSNQYTVAANLGLSVRQLRRQERVAERLLADQLWSQYHLNAQTPRILNLLSRTIGQDNQGNDEHATSASQQEELDWLRRSLISERIAIPALINRALKIVTPLASQSATQISIAIPPDLPPVIGQLTTARQTVLSLLMTALCIAPGGHVQIRAVTDAHNVVLEVHALTKQTVASSVQAKANEHLAMTRQLADLGGISFTVLKGGESEAFGAAIKFQVAEQLLVVVIDDNTDTLHLFERYLVGTRFRFVGQSNPADALSTAIEHMPDAIVLDVMLPGIDGWELLDRLRANPQTSNIPIAVCTILPHESLALSLGATAFLRKPVSRESLLSTLEHLVGQSWTK